MLFYDMELRPGGPLSQTQEESKHSSQGRSQDFSKGGGVILGQTISEYCRLFAYKKGLQRGRGHGHPMTPLATPLHQHLFKEDSQDSLD